MTSQPSLFELDPSDGLAHAVEVSRSPLVCIGCGISYAKLATVGARSVGTGVRLGALCRDCEKTGRYADELADEPEPDTFFSDHVMVIPVGIPAPEPVNVAADRCDGCPWAQADHLPACPGRRGAACSDVEIFLMTTNEGAHAMTTTGKRRFGKKRAVGCECTHMFTCRACLDAATAEMRLPTNKEHTP